MVFSCLRKFFNGNSQTSTCAKKVQDAKLGRKTIILNSLVDLTEEHGITVLGSTGIHKGEAHVQNLKNGNRMEMMPDGSTITRSEQGEIIRTCDVMKGKREYTRETETGDLLVKRFGVWSKPTNARLGDNGTLYFSRDGVEIEERLNGLHIHTNILTGVQIQTHHHNQFELVKLSNGEIWKRSTTREKETFVMWKNGKLTFKSETYFAPTRAQGDTPSGPQTLLSVSRWEQSWKNGQLTREKFTFSNPITQQKEVNLAVQLGTGMLSLKQVSQVITIFEDGKPKETTYDLKVPAKLRIDIPNKRCQLSDVGRVRSFNADPNVGIAFDTTDGHEYIVFSGNRGLPNRNRASEAADVIDIGIEDNGQPTADLVLR